MDNDLRVSIWNLLSEHYWKQYYSSFRSLETVRDSNFHEFSIEFYSKFCKRPVDTLPYAWDAMLKEFRELVLEGEWHTVYSFLEFVVVKAPDSDNAYGEFIRSCNEVFAEESSAYRFVSGIITPVTSPEEVDEIEEALTKGAAYKGVTLHLQTALKLLTDKKNPDPRNSMKESISAVESLAKHLTGLPKATLGEALTELEKKHQLDSVLKKAFSTLYGYTNNSDGIRHAVMADKSTLTRADARFMLIACSAFINYAVDKNEE